MMEWGSGKRKLQCGAMKRTWLWFLGGFIVVLCGLMFVSPYWSGRLTSKEILDAQVHHDLALLHSVLVSYAIDESDGIVPEFSSEGNAQAFRPYVESHLGREKAAFFEKAMGRKWSYRVNPAAVGHRIYDLKEGELLVEVRGVPGYQGVTVVGTVLRSRRATP